MKKKFVVLANSIKNGARCIGGREIFERTGLALEAGPWIRPVTCTGDGQIALKLSELPDKTQPTVLDIIEIEVSRPGNTACQPENWVLDESAPWRKTGRIDAHAVQTMVDTPASLWWHKGCKDSRRITQTELATFGAMPSMYLIRPQDVVLSVWRECSSYCPFPILKRQASFLYNGLRYALPVTDPEITAKYFRTVPALGAAPSEVRLSCGDGCLIAVSLSAPFMDGRHYKIAASFIELL